MSITQARTRLVLHRLWRHRSVRDVAFVAGGTAVAQAITVVVSPITTRLYGPEALGVLGTFTSTISVLLPISSLAYAHALILPRSDADALRLAKLAVLLSVISACVLTLGALGTKGLLLGVRGFDAISPHLFLIPMALVLGTMGHVCDQWLVRTKQFAMSSAIATLEAAVVSCAKIGLGFIVPGTQALIGVSFGGQALHAVLGAIVSRRSLQHRRASQQSIGRRVDPSTGSLVRTYRDFPLYRAPQITLNAVSQNIPVLMLASLFGPAAAGLYSVGHRVLRLPTHIVAQALGKVLQQQMVEAAHSGRSLQQLLTKATTGLAAIGFIPFCIVVAAGPPLFAAVFGQEWYLAGQYARWLAVWMFFGFANVPSVAAIPILALQRPFLVYEATTLALRASALLAGSIVLQSDLDAVALYSIVGAVSNIALIGYILAYSRRGLRADRRLAEGREDQERWPDA